MIHFCGMDKIFDYIDRIYKSNVVLFYSRESMYDFLCKIGHCSIGCEASDTLMLNTGHLEAECAKERNP